MSGFARCAVILLVLPAVAASPLIAQSTNSPSPIPVRVVLVTMFERGEDTGDTPGAITLLTSRASQREPGRTRMSSGAANTSGRSL